ncbi:DUF1871 family protein [Staphylococcus massiliensis]|uniref:DUF1871 domain-containing protein n=1 Tax=Staphylococcus massiliensis S46 TaxID=1229783 RepID=K9AL13_9STAP|nr:DUF1871 family protein [Staphylococcus massiliensis]EKU48048.1 hypothetical protein C273_06298 [Staphylococcus massiliensis S46]MCG3401641.1 YugE family protein [Staphylococcus massiliensis]MCG3412175.1 YugE family protein [Staphylococcus massiliensis]POA00063.1 DUF1871 domain-containing protein [Staphylococcus massiliensis CCUG 55927]
MNNNDLNIELYKLIANWNPMNFDDPTLGDAEVYEVMDQVHQLGEPDKIAHEIQNIYQFSFETTIPYERCKAIADQAVALKSSCKVN